MGERGHERNEKHNRIDLGKGDFSVGGVSVLKFLVLCSTRHLGVVPVNVVEIAT